jgi:hypothetical protein
MSSTDNLQLAMRAPANLLLLLAIGSTLGGSSVGCHAARPSSPPLAPEPAVYTRAPDYNDTRRALTTMQRPTLDLFTLDYTAAGRAIPVAVLAQPMVRSRAAARHSGRPVVLIVAGADGTDVDGTTALLATLRSRLISDSIVVVAIPMLNPDAADARAPTAVLRPALDGPDSVGTHMGPSGIDLTTDLLVPHATETRMLLGVLATWNPDVVVELRTTDLSPCAGDLAVSSTTDPAALLTAWWTRDRLVPELRRRLEKNDSVETALAGHLVPDLAAGPDTIEYQWIVDRGRGMTLPMLAAFRNRVGLRIDANARAPFQRRVTATIAALREILTVVAADRAALLDREDEVDSTVADWGTTPRNAPAIPLAPRLTDSVTSATIRVLRPTIEDSTRTTPLLVLVRDRYAGTVTTRLPFAYVLDSADTDAARLLARHGITVTRLGAPRDVEIIERFIPDSVGPPGSGHWLRVIGTTTVPAGTYIVPAGQPLAILAAVLLDPQSTDGLAAAGLLRHPVARLID